MLIGTWVKEIDRDQAMAVLRGQPPFDESSRIDDDPVEESAVESDVAGAQAADRSPEAAHEGVPERVREGASRQPR